MDAMPRKSRFRLPPLVSGGETCGQRLARLRKEKGYTQVELAEKIGIIQALVSAYEKDKLRVNSEMLGRIAKALEVSADEILGLEKSKNGNGTIKSRRLLRRLQHIERLPKRDQQTIIRVIDNALAASTAGQRAA